MTLLLSWIGKDSRKISSIYIASDSRISWDNHKRWDYAQKVFAFQNTPDIIGYCGDVVYPTIKINQILDKEKNNLLFPSCCNSSERSEVIYRELKNKFNDYPPDALGKSIEILHISRDNKTDFLCNVFRWCKNEGWSKNNISIPEHSDKVIVLGSGKEEFYKRYLEYLAGNSGKTSRALFQCLCHTLLKIKDIYCGGAPQLVGLYNNNNGKDLGIVYQDKRYYHGNELEDLDEVNNIKWRNELFECCDGFSKKILDSAQRQPNELRP